VELGGRKGGIETASLNQLQDHQHTILFSHYSFEHRRVSLHFPKRRSFVYRGGRVSASETMKWLWKAHDFCFLNIFSGSSVIVSLLVPRNGATW